MGNLKSYFADSTAESFFEFEYLLKFEENLFFATRPSSFCVPLRYDGNKFVQKCSE
jgi:hypothetical protein